jgi:glycosyltransferase involved in cell wall biosynthesis
MKILYVSQYFPPEMGAPSARVFELAREWVNQGHEVTVLTAFPHHPVGIKRKEDRGVLFRHEEKDGIKILRTYVYATANKGTLRRMLSYASFMISASVIGRFRCTHPDIIIGTSPQLLCARAAFSLSRKFKVPFVFEVRDLWPESILAVEAMKDNALITFLKKMAMTLYTRSAHIVTVGEGYKHKIHQLYNIPESKISVIPNGIVPEMFTPTNNREQQRKDLGWDKSFIVLYIGTHGMAHNLETLLQAANRLKDQPSIRFVLIGEGAEKENLKQEALKMNLTNVTFMDGQSREDVPTYYNACDLGVVLLRDTPLFREVLPSKIFEYLAMERPILITVDGQARELVEQNGAGWFVPPENPERLADSIRKLLTDHAALKEAGKNGRELVARSFTRHALSHQYVEILEALIKRHSA